MKLYFDENFPPAIPKALNSLEIHEPENEIFSTSSEFKTGIKDQLLIKKIGDNKGIWITFDRKALKAHYKVLKRYKVSVFAFEFGSHKYWEKVYLVLKHWKKIKVILSERKDDSFYMYRITKTKIVEVKQN
ncbi:MAG: hypothetical protein COA80_06105 [Leeuwenhoekiella sp.]|nr:MAG: hypothetical protein COA80_06105 [Leeuwenhoekiella sp.]